MGGLGSSGDEPMEIRLSSDPTTLSSSLGHLSHVTKHTSFAGGYMVPVFSSIYDFVRAQITTTAFGM